MSDTARPRVSYRVTIDDPTGPVQVQMRITGLRDGRDPLELAMVERYAFQSLPVPIIDGPRSGSASRQTGPRRWRVERAPGADVVLDWTIPMVHRPSLDRAQPDEFEHPYLAPDHGMLVAGAIFLVPTDPAASFTVDFQLPRGWGVWAPWGQVAPRRFAPDRRGLEDDVVAVGHWSAHPVEVDGFTATIAYAPGQTALAGLATPLVSRIVEAELDLFATRPAGTYLFLFGRPDSPGFAGSPKNGSMTLSVGPELAGPSLLRGIAHLVAHEFFHTWARSRFDSPDELRFFDEGFTDYYAHLICWRLGVTTVDELAATVAKQAAAYHEAAEATGMSLLAAGGPAFFGDPAAYRLVYGGGFVLAALLDLRIGEAASRCVPAETRSLDDLMRSFVNDPRWACGDVPHLADFLASVVRFTTAGTGEQARRWLEASERMEIDGARVAREMDRRRASGPPGPA